MKVLAAATLLVTFGMVGSMDYEDAVRQEAHYCKMVKAGHWPAFNKAINCKGQNHDAK